MVLTLAAVAAYKDIVLTQLAATVESHTEFIGLQTRTRFTTRLELPEGLTRRERAILYNSARHCEVHKMLRGQIEFEDHLVSEMGRGQALH